jgi:hypothetical protein
MPGFFDPDMKLNVQRRKLPHWSQEKVIYFVLLRLKFAQFGEEFSNYEWTPIDTNRSVQFVFIRVHSRFLFDRLWLRLCCAVTFRLSDSLPVHKLEALNEEKTRWLAANPLPHNDRQIKEYHRNFSRRKEAYAFRV